MLNSGSWVTLFLCSWCFNINSITLRSLTSLHLQSLVGNGKGEELNTDRYMCCYMFSGKECSPPHSYISRDRVTPFEGGARGGGFGLLEPFHSVDESGEVSEVGRCSC